MDKVMLEIYDTVEDWNDETPQRAFFWAENQAHEYMRGYGEYFTYDVIR